ncbi:MAG TPA: nitrate- and nitrite sensing domain-containing protein [Mycobacteriales bacterium]|nr:nitrate- and nitrite sensing domain-containing protein [Mycobacteriales bacterium]
MTRPAQPALPRGSERDGPPGPLARAKIRTKVALVLLLPVLAILGLAGVMAGSLARSASSAAAVERLARFGTVLSDLAHEVQRERDAAASWLGASVAATQPPATGSTPAGPPPTDLAAARSAVSQQASRTDQAIARLRTEESGLGELPAAVTAGLVQLADQLGRIPGIRQDVLQQRLGVTESQLRYTDVVDRLLTLGESVATGSLDGAVVQRVRALAAFSRMREYAAQELALVDGFLRQRAFGPGPYRSYLGALANQWAQYRQFVALATRDQREVAATTVSGPQVEQAIRLESAVARGDPSRLGVDPTQWSTAMMAKLDQMGTAEGTLSRAVIELAGSVRDDAVRAAVVDSALVAAALLATLGVSVLIGRTIVRPLSRLRAEILHTAHERLPAAVRRLRDPDAVLPDRPARPEELMPPPPPEQPTRPRPDNELGQLGAAFDTMHREAVRIALEQAALRRQVSATVVNLSRRSRVMVNRLIAQVDRLEAAEQDPDRLADLFRLDHLATRMRRNDENLLVLAGARVSRPRERPIPLLEVVRGAQSEVAQYTRIRVERVDPGLLVTGDAVDDLAHLLAELLDNAAQFSAPGTMVAVRVWPVGERRAVLEIDDSGIGVAAEEVAALNERLSRAASVEVAADRRLGLFVVGRLAARHGVAARLIRMPTGTRAEVVLPPQILLTPADLSAPGRPAGGPSGVAVRVQPFDKPVRASRMQYWQPVSDQPGDAPPAPPMISPATVRQAGVAGARLFPGNATPLPGSYPTGWHDRPQEVRRSLSALRRGVTRGRTDRVTLDREVW